MSTHKGKAKAQAPNSTKPSRHHSLPRLGLGEDLNNIIHVPSSCLHLSPPVLKSGSISVVSSHVWLPALAVSFGCHFSILTVSLSHCLTTSLPHCSTASLPHYLTASLYPTDCLTVLLSHCLTVQISLSHCPTISLSHCPTVSLSHWFSHRQCHRRPFQEVIQHHPWATLGQAHSDIQTSRVRSPWGTTKPAKTKESRGQGGTAALCVTVWGGVRDNSKVTKVK